MELSENVLTREQMKNLFEKGLNINNASMVYPFGWIDNCHQAVIRPWNKSKQELSVYTVTDVMEILPQIEGYEVNITRNMNGDYCAAYTKFSSYDITSDLICHNAKLLRDALYNLLIWTIENNYLEIKHHLSI